MVPKNGDLFEFKAWDGKTYFMFYMDGSLYKNQPNHVVAKVDGMNGEAVRIIRPECLRNAFECFAYGEFYDTDYAKHGKFSYIELNDKDKTDLINHMMC